MAATRGGAGSVGWSVMGKSVCAANGSSTSTSKTSAGMTGLSLHPVTTPTTARESVPPMWRASLGPRCPSTPPSSAITAWGATAPSRTWGRAACPHDYEPCRCSTTTRSKRSSRRTSRTWSWRSVAVRKPGLVQSRTSWTGDCQQRETERARERNREEMKGGEKNEEVTLWSSHQFYLLRFILHLLHPSLHRSGSLSGIKTLLRTRPAELRESLNGTFRKKRKEKR